MDEPNILLRSAMYHFAGGDAYLLGLAVFAAAQLTLCRAQVPWQRRWLIIAGRTGLIWAIADPSPVPWIVIAALVFLLLIAMVRRWRQKQPAESTDGGRAERLFRMPLACLAVISILCEFLYYWGPEFPASPTSIAIVGDSVTAGLNDGEETWPKQTAQESNLRVFDASQPGATLKSAVQQVELLNAVEADVLVLEIGGNDLLEWLPVADFEQNLERLLAATQSQRRPVVMFELPLPPLAVRYCEVQRRLASDFHVRLIPRRHFLRVLTRDGSTVDGIHLSKLGQTRLMELVRKLLKVAGPRKSDAGEYRHFEPTRPLSR